MKTRRTVTTHDYSRVNNNIAAWILLDNAYQQMLRDNAPREARMLILNHRSDNISNAVDENGDPIMSIGDFTTALQLTTIH